MLSNLKRATPHRGVIVVWIIVGACAAFVLLCLVAEAGNLWLARVQLQNALEAAALAAVDKWGDDGGGTPTLAARNRGIALAKANRVAGLPVVITDNRNAGNLPNENASCGGNLIFGSLVTTTQGELVFDTTKPGGCQPEVSISFEVCKKDAGGNPGQQDDVPGNLTVCFDSALLASTTVTEIRVTIPVLVTNPQQPYFDSDVTPVVGTTQIGITPGDITFSFDDMLSSPPSATDRFRTLVVSIDCGAFTVGDKFDFSFAIKQLNPPALPSGTKNTGDAWAVAPVSVSVKCQESCAAGANSGSGSAQFEETSPAVPNDGIAVAVVEKQGGDNPVVRAQAKMGVPTLCFRLLGISSFDVSAHADAVYDCSKGKPRLVLIDQFPSCPTLPTP